MIDIIPERVNTHKSNINIDDLGPKYEALKKINKQFPHIHCSIKLDENYNAIISIIKDTDILKYPRYYLLTKNELYDCLQKDKGLKGVRCRNINSLKDYFGKGFTLHTLQGASLVNGEDIIGKISYDPNSEEPCQINNIVTSHDIESRECKLYSQIDSQYEDIITFLKKNEQNKYEIKGIDADGKPYYESIKYDSSKNLLVWGTHWSQQTYSAQERELHTSKGSRTLMFPDETTKDLNSIKSFLNYILKELNKNTDTGSHSSGEKKDSFETTI